MLWCFLPVGALALLGASAARGRVAAPTFQLGIAFYLWLLGTLCGWFVLGDASSKLDCSLASVLQAARFLIFSKTRDAQDKRVNLISCQPDVLRPCPHSSTSSAENLEPDGAAPA